MDILEILKKIRFREDYLRYFENAFLMTPEYSEKKHKVVFRVVTEKILPFDVYRRLRDLLSQVFDSGIELIIKANDNTINTSELTNYFLDFARINSVRSDIPLVTNEKINISLPAHEMQLLRDYLYDKGITYELVSEAITIQEKETESREYLAKPANNRFRSRAVTVSEADKDKYRLMPIASLKAEMKDICVLGKVFKVEYQTFRNGREMQKIYLTDYQEAVIIKRFEDRMTTKAMLHEIEEGQIVKVYGSMKHDDYERDDVLTPTLIEKCEQDPWARVDGYPGEKHIELHAHTNRSEMDGVADTAKLIKRAF